MNEFAPIKPYPRGHIILDDKPDGSYIAGHILRLMGNPRHVYIEATSDHLIRISAVPVPGVPPSSVDSAYVADLSEYARKNNIRMGMNFGDFDGKALTVQLFQN